MPASPAAPFDPHPIRVITFDAGGTLIYPHPPVGEVYAATLARRGLPADAALIGARFAAEFTAASRRPRTRLDQVAERQFWREVVRVALDGQCPTSLLDEVFDELWEAYAHADCWKLFPDAVLTVDTLRRRGYRVALLSNADERFRQTFRELGLADHFERMFISSELGVEKPDPRLFARVRCELGVEPRQILHVGDSAFHDGGATDDGWQVVIVRRDLPDLASLLPLLPDRA